MIDIRKLNTLSEVICFGSIRRATYNLGYSQPGLTNILNRFEDEVRFDFIDRGSSGVKLNTTGMQLMPYIEKLLDENKC